MNQFDGTTIVSVRNNNEVAMGGDGQVSLGETIMKSKAVKVKRIYQDKVLVGFAGGTADAFTLFEKFENFLDKYSGQLTRAAVELAKEWRSDRALRKLEAMLIVADQKTTLLISGNGDVIEPEDDILAIGSGGGYARAAASALTKNTGMSPKEIVANSLNIAADICVFTNHNHTIETIAT